jgi:Fungal specific transcription factor domain
MPFRVAFITYLLDLEVATQFHTLPLLTFAEFNVELPASDALWNADSAATWLRLMISSPQQPLSFFAAVQALLAPYPAPSSQISKILAQIQQLSSFPSVILSRTLSFQQAKVESAMRQYDPFQLCFGEFEGLRATEKRNDDILQRIAEGREMLKRVPGNLRGGRGWYEAMVPTMVSNGHPPPP